MSTRPPNWTYDPEQIKAEARRLNDEIATYGQDIVLLYGTKTVPVFSDDMGIMGYVRPAPIRCGDVCMWKWFGKLARGVVIEIRTSFERTVYTVYSPDTGFVHEHNALTMTVVMQPDADATRAVLVALAYHAYRERLKTSSAWRERLSLMPEYSTNWSLFHDRRIS